MKNKNIICWWSGGVTSAVACKIAIDLYGKDRCQVIMIDTHNEDEDTYRFKKDCEKWYGLPVDTISAIDDLEYASIEDVWVYHESLNVATGAICSTKLKREVRERWQKENTYQHQIFGFEFDKKEMNRALAMAMNHPVSKPIFPLLMLAYDKRKCIEIIQDAGFEVPRAYSLGFSNNNCLKTGCVQGGIGYWQKMQRDFPDKFDKMAEMEHKLTALKGQPVTMLKDQSNKAKSVVEKTGDKTLQLVFLKPHPDYPDIKDISQMKGREPEPLFECNGFCGTNDLLKRKKSEQDINFET